MGWNTVDKSKSHEARGEDVERRELRLRRTYNEAASGHRLLAQNSAEAPPRAEIDALYWSVLEEVGTARSGKEEAWDGALRVACARHLSELREAGGDGDGAVEAACFAADAAPADAGLWLRLHRLAAGATEGGEKWPAYNRCRVAIEAARRVEELHGAFGAGAAAKVVARIPALVRRAYASLDVVAPPAPPARARGLRREARLLGLGDAVLGEAPRGRRRRRGRARASLEAPLAFTIAYDEEQLSRSTSINPSLSRSAPANPPLSPSPLSVAAKLPRSPELERIAGATARVLEDFYGEALPAEILVFAAELAWTGDGDAPAFDDRRARAAFGGEAVAELAARLHWLDAVVAQARGDARARAPELTRGAAAVAPPRDPRDATGARTGAPAPSPSGESPRPPEPPQIQDLWDAVLDDYVAEAGARTTPTSTTPSGDAAGDAVRRALDGQGAGADVVSVLCGTCGDRYARCDLALQVAVAAPAASSPSARRRRPPRSAGTARRRGRVAGRGAAVFLRGRVAWLARSASKAPRGGRRPVDTKDTELFAAQCWYDFVGCRVLRDVANSRVDDKLRAKRLRLLGPSERHAFVRHVAPLVLRDKCGDEAPLPLAPRRDVLDALEAVARASRALEENRSGDDDDVEAYLFAPTDEPRTFPAYLLGTAASVNGDGACHAAPEDPADAGERLLAEMMVLKLTQRDKEAAQETKTPAALELSRLEALRWHLRCCALEPRRAAHWAAAARTLEDLAAPLLSLGRLAAPAGVGLRRCACLSTRSLVAKPFGNDAALVATAREMPRGPWYRFPELGQDWIDAMAEAKAEARREAAKRCWVVAHGLANGSRGAYAAAVGCLCYEDARDASKLGNVTTAFRHSTDAKTAFEAAASLGAPATRAFALMMAGKLAWRDAARPFDDRASAAIASFAASPTRRQGDREALRPRGPGRRLAPPRDAIEGRGARRRGPREPDGARGGAAARASRAPSSAGRGLGRC
ncbi:hypothetical protein SO694_00073048 [Aureococcus anophagefferens]|uniref:Nuclear pore complex protein n=1 Tax=Aureococcus anophagefferens TaxID=44056 RepID=A0ABR1FI95_AURAN